MTYFGEHKQIYNCTCCVCGDEFQARRKYAKYCEKKYCQIIRKKKNSIYHVSRNYNSNLSIYYRKCLRCDRKFQTRNKFIRMCGGCHKTLEHLLCEEDFGGG